jgi:hypothetical protein
VNGSIKGLSSSNLSKADVELKGLLDSYGKLSIAGQINPLSEKAYTDLTIKVENLGLQNFSSYSAQYLGFPITRGKADFDLKYKLNQSLLEGINKLEFKQLKFGDKTASKEAVNLPLKLAVSLLTNGKGIMAINLPVRGNIDDPEFSYGGIVFKAFFKLITGIVASPFKLLGKLVPGGADLDLSGIQFVAGTSTITPQESKKLKAMQKIIEKRPAIILELTGVIHTINDEKALKTTALLKKLKLKTVPDFTKNPAQKDIEKLYIKTFSKEKWLQLLEQTANDETTNQTIALENAYTELLIQQNVKEQLNVLAKQRAKVIQQILIEDYKVSVDKIFLKPSEQSDTLYPQVKFGVGN